MLLSHRFWGLVASIDESLTDPATTQAMKWTLEASFGGYEGDELQLRLSVGEPARRYPPSDEGLWSEVTLEDLVSGRAQAIPLSLANALQAGAIPLMERDGGRWTFNGRFPPPDESVVLLVSPELHAQLGDVGRPSISLGSGWCGSARLSKGELEVVRARLHGVIDPAETLIAFEIEGGVHTGRSTYLGRPGFLPHLHASDSATLRAEPLGEVNGVLGIVGVPPRSALSSKAPVTGRWRLTATEGEFDYHTIITLEADAPERDFVLADRAYLRLEPELEIRVDDFRRMAPPRKASRVSQSAPATDLDNLLEAICAAPARGWTEAELIPLVQAGLSDPRMVWDMVRSLAEAGWIDPYVSNSWRAREWRLRRPGLVEISTDCVLIDGAVGARSTRRLMSAVTACGGKLEVRDGISQFAPPTMVVHGISCSALAAECG
jgi:hypothetical protein